MNTVLEFLGSGTSTGVPIPGCRCSVCRSPDPRDRRWRASALVSRGARRLVIDTGPEFRLQCLRAGVGRLDAVLLTHRHADHLNGLDDLRAYSWFRDRTLPVWGDADTLRFIRERFDYIWHARQAGGGLPDIRLRLAARRFRVIGLDIVPVPIRHGKMDMLGYRIGDLAYLTDISRLPEPSLPLLSGLRTLVTSCVHRRSHPTHLSLAGVRRLHEKLRPERTILTHISHWFSHREILEKVARLDILPAHDGMRVEIGT